MFLNRATRLSFQTKVLVPVVTVMILVLIAPLWTVSYWMSKQLELAAIRDLSTADAVFKDLQTVRQKNLLMMCRNIPSEPRFQAVAQKADAKTMEFLLRELIAELGGDILLFVDKESRPLAHATRDPVSQQTLFDQRCEAAVEQALRGEASVDTISVGSKLYEIVSVSAAIGSPDNIVGVLVIGRELGSAAGQEIEQLTQSEVIFLTESGIAISTPHSHRYATEFHNTSNNRPPQAAAVPDRNPLRPPVHKVRIDGEHYMFLSGDLSDSPRGAGPRYILLRSYEAPLREVHVMRQKFLGTQLGGIAAGTLIVWVLIRRTTKPLRILRDSAEAVGRGDFSRRIEVRSRDECGELAGVFNQMTANLQASRKELEQAVQTLRSTQAQLIQSEKMRAIGTLAGGIAHDFNNIIGSILGFSELLLEDAPAESRTARNLRQVIKAGQRAKNLVRQILDFSRQSPPERSPVRLSACIEETLQLMQPAVPPNVTIRSSVGTSSDTVLADATQLHQVLMNLGTNACHAMRKQGGTLTIALSEYDLPLPEGSSEAPSSLPAGKYLKITVADTGHGMDQAVLQRVFEPFFTTKPVGEGTGLGLSVVHGILKNHGGDINVTSQPGVGTTFCLLLPKSEEPAVARAHLENSLHGNSERMP